MLKYFVQEQHALHDAEAKKAAQEFWIKHGYKCIKNPNKYGVDLMVDGKGRKFGCEVETKTGRHGLSSIIRPFAFPSERKSLLEITLPFLC